MEKSILPSDRVKFYALFCIRDLLGFVFPFQTILASLGLFLLPSLFFLSLQWGLLSDSLAFGTVCSFWSSLKKKTKTLYPVLHDGWFKLLLVAQACNSSYEDLR